MAYSNANSGGYDRDLLARAPSVTNAEKQVRCAGLPRTAADH
jgi:hypothetical protein